MPSTWSPRLVIAGLLVLCLVPALAGTVRLVELATGAEITPDNVRFFTSPVPVVLHVVGAVVFTVVGAFQFAPRLRRQRPGWHRAAGRVLVPAGLMGALSGLWLTLFFPVPARDEGLLEAFRIVVGAAMVVTIVLGFLAVRRRDIARHRAWMIRAYALALGTGTQAAVLIPYGLIVGPPTGLAWPLLMGSGWAINAVVAELVIRRPVLERRTEVVPGAPAPSS